MSFLSIFVVLVFLINAPDHQSNHPVNQERDDHLQDVVGDDGKDRVTDELIGPFVIHAVSFQIKSQAPYQDAWLLGEFRA
jgi:hypothetical protein